MSQFAPPPAQPDENSWGFIDELKAPLWDCHQWVERDPHSSEADLGKHVRIVQEFPDPQGLLETACDDLRVFLAAGNVRVGHRGYVVQTTMAPMLLEEAYRIEVEAERCVVTAEDTEGIRRGLVRLEDDMLHACGAFLPLGTRERRPFVKRRISRCFFGPIKRPPKLRDELMDDVDYYPAEYLNRLAHEGVNGLWLTIEFRDLCRTSITPHYGAEAEQRLSKLRRTVETCRRYGIRTYIFCIEPRAWDADDPVLAEHPELAIGSPSYGNKLLFCPFSDTAQQYLYEAVNGIFAAVPNLGGLINISHGERATTCLSGMAATANEGVRCPVCSQKQPWEILHASLTPMERGMHDANPDAELISWLYMPQNDPVGEWVFDIPQHTPEGVILQFNFETGVRSNMFGEERIGGDYWISNPGPSERFSRVAEAAREAGTHMSAKIQTGCSHEVASVPFVPVPSLLYEKFDGMRELGVTHTMLCWYFGNYPGLMNKAAGELSFLTFHEGEAEFLMELAAPLWGGQSRQVVKAWRLFSEAYANYPLTNLFQYYGPMHDGPVWPLHLEPEDAQLSPTWLLGSTVTREAYPPSADRIAEAFAYDYTLEEALELCRRIAEGWDRGMEILAAVRPHVAGSRERVLDIGVAEALGLQFRSAYSILQFYDLRERMLRMEGMERLELLEAMQELVREEIANDERLIELCDQDSRLGFHSEAEGYKYFPDKLRWRADQLGGLLDREFPAAERAIRNGNHLFPEYTGMAPTGPTARCKPHPDLDAVWANPEQPFDEKLVPETSWPNPEAPALGDTQRPTRWGCWRDEDAIYLLVHCTEPDARNGLSLSGELEERTLSGLTATDSVIFRLEPRRLWPSLRFGVAVDGGRLEGEEYDVRVGIGEDAWQAIIRIPYEVIGADAAAPGPIRVDVQRNIPSTGGRAHEVHHWLAPHPWLARLRLGADNPADLGWLVFE